MLVPVLFIPMVFLCCKCSMLMSTERDQWPENNSPTLKTYE